MKVYKVIGLGVSRIEEVEVASMDDEYVYNEKGLRSHRYMIDTAYEYTYADAVRSAILLTCQKIQVLTNSLTDLYMLGDSVLEEENEG